MTSLLTLSPIAKIGGQIDLPGSKSLTNRALLLAAVAHGKTTLSNILFSDDTDRMIQALKALGTDLTIDAQNHSCEVIGRAGPFDAQATDRHLDLGNAGTALRPLVAMLSLSEGRFVIDGDEYMRVRPIKHLTDALSNLGVPIEFLGQPGYPPLQIKGGYPQGGAIELNGDLSSQYLTALLMALPLAPNDSTINIVGELVSKPYVDMTLAIMAKFGVKATHTRYHRFDVPGAQTYQSPGHLMVEGDASTASYFLAAAAIQGEITVTGVGSDSLQGDIAFADVLSAMGAAVTIKADRVSVRSTGVLNAIDADLNHIPDAAMTVAILALFAKGTTTIRNVYNWRIKETDRMTAMANELRKVGAAVSTTDDSITITPPDELLPASISTYGDHRMAMCFSLLALAPKGITICDPEVTKKTFPDYFNVFNAVTTRI